MQELTEKMNDTQTSRQQLKRQSKFLSLVLRHQPGKIGITLDEAGWIDVDVLLRAMADHGQCLSRATLETVVRENDKQRFALSEDGTRIRANQGHSIQVELGYAAADPPEILLHGTPSRFVDSIREAGIKAMDRHHVHLHSDESTAAAVGRRRGKPVLLRIRSREMFDQGHKFFVTPNQVWLTDYVPPSFIDFPD